MMLLPHLTIPGLEELLALVGIDGEVYESNIDGN